jgi:hypothetical protein
MENREIKIILPSNYILEQTADGIVAAPPPSRIVNEDDDLPTYEHAPPATDLEAGEPDAQIPEGRIYSRLKSCQVKRQKLNLVLRGLLTLFSILVILTYIIKSSLDGVLLVIGILSLIWSFTFLFKMLLGRKDTTIRFLAFVIFVGDTFFVVCWSILTISYIWYVSLLCLGLVLLYIAQWGLDLALFFVVCKEARFVRIEEGKKGFEKYTVKFNFGGKESKEDSDHSEIPLN